MIEQESKGRVSRGKEQKEGGLNILQSKAVVFFFLIILIEEDE